MLRRLLPLLLLVPLLLPATPTRADDIDVSAAQQAITTLLQEDPGTDPRDLWRLSESLAATGKPAIQPLREAAPSATPPRRLAIARALIILEDYTKGLELLKGLVDDESVPDDLKVPAIRLIGEEGELEEAEWLEDRIDKTFEPRIKMAMARALWALNFTNKKKGKDVLLAYLKSTDPDLRAEGALALGEIGAAADARPVLRELRDEPTERGRSAAFLLKILELEQQQEQSLRGPSPEPDPDLTGGKADRWPLLNEIFDTLEKLYVDPEKIDHRKIEDAMAAGINEALDPFTDYLSPEQNAKLREGLDPTYGGVGAYVYNDPQNQERFTISRPIFGGPLYRAGLRTGDVVLSIEGKSTEGMSVEEAVHLLKGPPGTGVVVSIYRRGWDEPRPFTLTRARITIPTTAYDILPGRIGFLQILSFSQDTTEEVSRILDLFQKQGIRGLIIDLRFNGGGYLHAAVGIASQFLPRGTLVVSEKGRRGVQEERKHYSSGDGDKRPRVPIVVLANQATASAAEILSGALKIEGGATLVGKMTYGKGSVQRPWPLHTRPGEPFEDQVRDVAVSYDDKNGNEKFDPGEPVRLRPMKDGVYDDPEKFVDANGNGVYDPGESFTDENLNGKWDDGEPFEDRNGNGIWDPGANLKLTIAAYYLPDGTRLQRKTEIVDGKTVVTGGIKPDIEAEPEPVDFWVLQQQREIEAGDKIDAYVDKLFEEHPDLMLRLARSDQDDPSLYPGFDAFVKSLDTPLSPEDVRFVVRFNVRRHIGDDLGRELVGDVVDDLPLQAALRSLFGKMGVDLGSVEDLEFLAKKDAEKAGDTAATDGDGDAKDAGTPSR